jgi:hypothetical protein
MTGTRIFFMLLSALLALTGLFTIGGAQDVPLAIFGWGVFGFGTLFGLSLIKRSFDEAEG